MKIFKREQAEVAETEDNGVESSSAPISVYLSGPFSGLGMKEAVELHRTCAAHLVRMGYAVVSPIMNSVAVWVSTREEVKAEWWLDLEPRLIEACDVVCVIITPATFLSDGVRREVEIARQKQKPLRGIIPLAGDRFVIADLEDPHD